MNLTEESVHGVKIRSKEVSIIPLKSVKLNPKNRNVHTAEQIDRLCKIIKYQGFREPITISNQSGLCAAGEGRVLAMDKLGADSIAAIYEDFDSPDMEYAHLVADNEIARWATLDTAGVNFDLAELDGVAFDLDMLGIKDFVLDPADKYGDRDADATPEIRETCIRLGDLFLLGDKHRLLCGDSTDSGQVGRFMNGEKADMVFTSPPYADVRDYGGGLDLTPASLARFFDWPSKIFCVNLGLIIREREIVRYWDDYLAAAKNRGLKLLAWNVWDKEHASAPAHQQAMFGLSHEWIFVFGEYRELNLTNPNKGAGFGYHGAPSVREADGTLSKRSSNGMRVRSHRQLDSIFNLTRQHNYAADYVNHPAVFPVALPEEYIKAVSNEKELVADPFLGSGSTLIACEKTNRKCYGMEIDPQYCQVIIDRWEKFTGQKAIKL